MKDERRKGNKQVRPLNNRSLGQRHIQKGWWVGIDDIFCTLKSAEKHTELLYRKTRSTVFRSETRASKRIRFHRGDGIRAQTQEGRQSVCPLVFLKLWYYFTISSLMVFVLLSW